MTIATGQTALAADVLAAVANAGTPIIANISALRALTTTTTATSVLVSGYYLVGDAGGGLFVLNASDTSSSDNGGTIIVDAANRRWYRLYGDHVTVLMFGAKGDGTTDDAPAFRAAIAANVAPVVVPGYGRTYLFNSNVSSPYPYYLPAGVLISNVNGFRLVGQGRPIITMGTSVAGSEHFIIRQCNDFYVGGLVHQGNRSGLSSGVENPGYAVHSCSNFMFENLHFIGNWGGEGSMFACDWLVNGVWEHIIGDAVGIGFDTAFLRNCTFRDCIVVGADTNGNIGTNQIGDRMWSCIYDLPAVNDNASGTTFTNTSNVTLENCAGSNFANGLYLASGTDYNISGCRFFGNPGANSTSGYGIAISWLSGGSFPSAGFPVKRVVIEDCEIYNNGQAVSGAGILIDGSTITNSDVLSDIRIQDCLIYNNTGYGVNVAGQTHVSDIIIEDCLITTNTTALSTSILSGMVTSTAPYGATLRNNPTINPMGTSITPSLPGGTGSGNSVVNTSPVLANVIISTQTSAYGIHIQAPNSGTLSALGTVAANSGPFSFRLLPGYAVWFDTAVPSSWVWFGE